MERDHSSRNGIITWLLLLAAAVGLSMVAREAHSVATELGSVFLGLGGLVALVAWFQSRLLARETAERLELEDLARSKGETALFANSGDDALHAKRSREQFEKWVVPVITVILFLLQAGAAWWFYGRINAAEAPTAVAATLSMAILAGVGLVLFLVGTYGARLARYENLALLRPGASALLLGAVICALCTCVEAAAYFNYPKYDRYAAWLLLAILAVVAAETLVTLVFEIYRPRVKGKETRLVYESRLIGLLGSSGGLFTTAAHTLDYQFGFKVSETWFYRFLEQAVGRLILIWAGILWFSTCFEVVEPTQQGLLERFGKPVADGVLEPGLHLKLPWPIDRVEKVAVRELQTFAVGYETDPEKEKERTVVWTTSHYKEESLMLVASRDQAASAVEGAQAVPVNLLMASIPVQFFIRDVRSWAYKHAEAKELLQHIANREVMKYMVGVDMVDVMSSGRAEAAAQLKRRIQAEADRRQLGVEIAFVGLQDMHPPIGSKEVQVAVAFEKEVGAQAQKEARIHEAEAYRARLLPKARADAAKVVNDAKARSIRDLAEAEGRANQFRAQITANRAAPTMFRERALLEGISKAVAPARKMVVLSADSERVVQIDLQEKIRSDLLDAVIESPNKGDATPK